VSSIVLTVRYPDDSIGVSVLDEESMRTTTALLFVEDVMDGAQRALFNRDPVDWTMNPALIRVFRPNGGSAQSEGVCALRTHTQAGTHPVLWPGASCGEADLADAERH
jgi:hypothetical protein